MDFLTNWIIIGGTGRNTGKTTLAEKLIEKFGSQVPVTAVKISNIKPENSSFHGHDVNSFRNKILIKKETRSDGKKDSMRFLRAGAFESWFIQTEDAFLPETFPEIQTVLKKAQWIVCESNSLRNFVKPGLFIMVKGENGTFGKKDVPGLLQRADVVVEALQWKPFDALVKRIEIKDGKFVLL
ncbi:MAG: hypothetical protein IEMM0006_0947 [bacterium]|nr:MAG: hypothetical protein IEMM0006_0947 [bacterium]